jgi:hypothetical protein
VIVLSFPAPLVLVAGVKGMSAMVIGLLADRQAGCLFQTRNTQ